MIKKQKGNKENKKDHDSELILKILNKAVVKDQKNNDKELYVDENWKINSRGSTNQISNKNSKLIKILSESFPDKKISVINKKDGSQTILIL